MKKYRWVPFLVLLFFVVSIPCLSQIEQTGKRTYTSKTYKNPDGSFTLDAHGGHIHYKEDGNFVDCDYHLADQGTYWSLTKASYRLYIAKDFGASQLIRFDNRFEGANHTIYYEPHSIWWVNRTNPGDRTKIRDAQSVMGVLDAEQRVIKYTNAFGNGIDFEITIRRSGFQKEVVIPNQLPLNPPTPDHVPVVLFKYTADGLTLKANDGQDWDGDSYYEGEEGFTVREAIAQYGSYIKRSYIRDANRKDPPKKLKIFWEKRNGVLWQAKVIPLNFLNNATYPVRLDTVTDYYVGAGDGVVQMSDSDWDTAHDAATGSSAAPTGSVTYLGVYHSDDVYYYYRGFCPVDTSGIPNAATISAAVYYFYISTIYNTDNDGQDYYVIVGETTQDSDDTLITADFNTCGAVDDPTQGSDTKDIGNLTDDQYNTLDFNATGLGWIDKEGTTLIGIREGHDCEDDAIGDGLDNTIEVRWSEFANTGSDPYLKITYTTGETFIPKVIWFK